MMLRPAPLPPSFLGALFPFHRDVKNVETWSGTVHMRIQGKEMKIFFHKHLCTRRVMCLPLTFFSAYDAESEMPEISNLAVFDPKPQNEDFFPSAVMNGVKRSETRVLALSLPLSLCARACHLPPLEMRYKSPPRNKFMNTLLAFFPLLFGLRIVLFPLLLDRVAPILILSSLLEPLKSS